MPPWSISLQFVVRPQMVQDAGAPASGAVQVDELGVPAVEHPEAEISTSQFFLQHIWACCSCSGKVASPIMAKTPDKEYTRGDRLFMGLVGSTLVVQSQEHSRHASRGTSVTPLQYYFFDVDSVVDANKGRWQQSLKPVSHYRFKILSNSAGGVDLYIRDENNKLHQLQSGTPLTGELWKRNLGKNSLKFAFTGTDSAGNVEQLVVYDGSAGGSGNRAGNQASGFNLR